MDRGAALPDTPTRREEESPIPAEPERRWSALTAWFTAPLIPATTARRTQHISLKRAYAVHLLTGLLAVVAVLFLIAWECNPRIGWVDSPTSLASVWWTLEGFVHLMAEIAAAFREEPYVIPLAVTAGFLAVEAGYLVLGFIVAPWGARDETIHASFCNGVRRTWLHTSHVLLLIVVVGGFTVFVTRHASDWYRNHQYDWPDPPRAPAGVAPGTPAWDQHQAALKEHEVQAHASWERWQRSRPFIVRRGDAIMACVYSAAFAWWLVALLRGVGADRPTQPVHRPPLCEACGYNLTHAPLDGRCSECGAPVAASLGPDARPGTWWDRRHRIGRFRAGCRCAIDAILRPDRLGRAMQASATAHRRFLIASLPLLYAAAFLGLATFVSARTGELPPDGEWVWFLIPISAVAGHITGLGVLSSSAAALLVGIGYWFREKRNLLPATMQAACYLNGFLSLWILFLLTLSAGLTLVSDPLYWWARDLNLPADAALVMIWCTPNVVCLVWYFTLIVKITAAARYANK
jgi:hypothetical protein